MSKHTPAPWSWANGSGAGIEIWGYHNGQKRVLLCDPWRQFPDQEWDCAMEANARLVAAAPDLLAAAKSALYIAEAHIIDTLEGTKSFDAAMASLDPIRKAIKKAEAKQ